MLIDNIWLKSFLLRTRDFILAEAKEKWPSYAIPIYWRLNTIRVCWFSTWVVTTQRIIRIHWFGFHLIFHSNRSSQKRYKYLLFCGGRAEYYIQQFGSFGHLCCHFGFLEMCVSVWNCALFCDCSIMRLCRTPHLSKRDKVHSSECVSRLILITAHLETRVLWQWFSFFARFFYPFLQNVPLPTKIKKSIVLRCIVYAVKLLSIYQ